MEKLRQTKIKPVEEKDEALSEASVQPDYIGHRQRLKARFIADKGKSMPDYELLELLLTYAIPRRDVKPLAKALLRKYGNLAGVVTAPVEELMKQERVGEHIAVLLGIVFAVANKISWENLENADAPVLSDKTAVVEYCRSCIGYSAKEELLIIYLNKQGMYITHNIEQVGTIDAVMISPREIVADAIANNASAIIMAHNHPSGNVTPSHADVEMTKLVAKALTTIGIKLEDHLIITRGGHYSMRERASYALLGI